ncbi:MAG: FlgD immunoglobulin-like domain containing protein [Verrucomicrobiota bacterium]
MSRLFWVSLLACAAVATAQTPPPTPAAGDFLTVSTPVSPRVSYALSRTDPGLLITIDVARHAAVPGAVRIQLGVAGTNPTILTEKDAAVETRDGITRHRFGVRWEQLGKTATRENPGPIRLAFSVEWMGGPAGGVLQRETFAQNPLRATHAGLSPNPADWQTMDLVEFERNAADRRERITFSFTQPVDGKASVVIEDVAGRRVSNLVSAVNYTQGVHTLVWDGRDEAGQVVAPGDYRWRSISHPGLAPDFQMSFVNGPGSNHGTLHAATATDDLVFLGTALSEGGYQVIALTPAGDFVRGMNAPHGVGLGRIALAADDTYLYAAYDGTAWLQKRPDETKPDWKVTQQISLVRFRIADGNIAEFPGGKRFLPLNAYEVGPGSPNATPKGTALVGLALFNNRLFLADRISATLQEIDPRTGRVIKSRPFQDPVALVAGKDALYALSGNRLFRLDPDGGETRLIATLGGKPAALAVGRDGQFFVSDRAQNVIHVLKPDGSADGIIGHPGVLAPGPFDPLQLQNPAGLAQAANGWLWVTEEDRWQPKRLAAYDPATRTVARQWFGPTAYGAPGAGFDPTDHTRWIGQDTLFKIDFEHQTATPVSILGGQAQRHYHFFEQDGRTFVSGPSSETHGSGVMWIQELKPDNTLRPLALVSSAHRYAFDQNWHPPQAFIDAFKRDLPEVAYQPGVSGSPGHGYGMLWMDQDGDGQMSAEEIEFTDGRAAYFPGPFWAQDIHDLTIRMPVLANNKPVLITMKPDGWWPGGAPRYPSLKAATEAGRPIGDGSVHFLGESTVDRFGNVIVNSDPAMAAIAPDGSVLWTYPNRWSGVHGSHKAPLPTPGELQGVLFFCGTAPLDDLGDVVAMVGNHGRVFLMTSDGLYLDEMFPDVRLTSTQTFTDRGILGGEAFGGSFGRSEKTGDYYFQGGGIEYRIFKVDGLRHTQRNEGRFTVTGNQIQAAERNLVRTLVPQTSLRAAIPFRATPPVIDGRDDEWSSDASVLRWSQQGNRFPVELNAAHDATHLYLLYSVRDDSPWVNNGRDWRMLFKTGDGVDIQLGVNPAANPARSAPVPGDLRVFIAPFDDRDVAVLYRHRLPDAPADESSVFQSPWRSEKVDSVRQLENARIAVQKQPGRYLVEIALPLADLGLAGKSGIELRGDVGVIYGDAAGTTNILRNYWANPATGLVNDVPGEIMLTPNAWGDIILEKQNP